MIFALYRTYEISNFIKKKKLFKNNDFKNIQWPKQGTNSLFKTQSKDNSWQIEARHPITITNCKNRWTRDFPQISLCKEFETKVSCTVFKIFLEHKRTVRFIIKGRLRLIAKPSHHLFLGWILPDRVEGFLAAVRLRLFNLYCLGGWLHLQYKQIHSWKSNLLMYSTCIFICQHDFKANHMYV